MSGVFENEYEVTIEYVTNKTKICYSEIFNDELSFIEFSIPSTCKGFEGGKIEVPSCATSAFDRHIVTKRLLESCKQQKVDLRTRYRLWIEATSALSKK